MPDWIIVSPGFWWTVAGLLLLYYATLLSLLFGPAFWVHLKSRGRKRSPDAIDQESRNRELCRAFQEYAGVYQKLDRPRFTEGRLIVPSHIHLDLLLKQPFCQAVERESSTSKPS
ncbi:hypothetical protein [Echinicola sediminis]